MKETVTFREIRYQDKRRKILKNAARIFARKGYENSSLEEIAARLKLSKGSLYHYIKSKDELLYLIQLQAIEEAIDNARQVLEKGFDPVQTLYLVLKGHVRIVTQMHVVGALRQQERILRKKWREKIIDNRDRLDAIFQQIINSGVEAGSFEVTDSRVFRLAMVGVTNDIIRWYSPRGRLSVDEIGDCVADFILKGFGVSSEVVGGLKELEER